MASRSEDGRCWGSRGGMSPEVEEIGGDDGLEARMRWPWSIRIAILARGLSTERRSLQSVVRRAIKCVWTAVMIAQPGSGLASVRPGGNALALALPSRQEFAYSLLLQVLLGTVRMYCSCPLLALSFSQSATHRLLDVLTSNDASCHPLGEVTRVLVLYRPSQGNGDLDT
jgi:hypothetical protein